MKIKAYSQLSEVQNDIRRLSKEFARNRKVYLQSKSALASAKLEVTAAGLTKIVEDRQFWKCFEFSSQLAGLNTVLANIDLALYHQFGEDEAFDVVASTLGALRDRVTLEAKGLQATIAVLAQKQAPRPFKREVQGLKEKLAKLACTATTVEYQFVPAPNGMYFVSYLSFANLKDQNGYTNPNFYVAIAKFYGQGNPHLRMSVSRGKKQPSEMTEVAASSLWSSVRSGLRAKNVSVEKLP